MSTNEEILDATYRVYHADVPPRIFLLDYDHNPRNHGKRDYIGATGLTIIGFGDYPQARTSGLNLWEKPT